MGFTCWRRTGKFGVAALAVASALLLAVSAALLAAAPAAAAGTQITDCSSDTSTSNTSGTLLYAVTHGGTWTFACSGTGPFTIDITAPLNVATGTTAALESVGEAVYLSGGKSTELFTVNGSLTLDGLTLENGSAPNGGAIYDNSGGTLAVTNSTFSGNTAGSGTATGDGGAIYSAGTLTVSNSTFSHNGSSFGDGGAIYSTGTLTVTNSTFSGNSPSSYGGAIYNHAGTLTVTQSTLTGNSAAIGGALYNHAGTLTVISSTFSGNNAPSQSSSGGGGAIANNRDGTLTVTNSTFSDNSAASGGSGGAIDNFGALTVAGSTFSGNSAPVDGGAIFTGDFLTPSSAFITNSTFSGNGAFIYPGGGTGFNGYTNPFSGAQGGGAIFSTNAPDLTVTNSTLSGNSASDGSNLGGYGGTLYNTIVANPQSGNNCALAYAGANDLEYGDTSCAGTTTGVWTTGDPKLGALADNGGPTQTMALGAGSAALGAGDPTYCDSLPVGGFDQRGVARGTTTGTCDIGAYQATSAASDPAAQYVVQPEPDIAPPGSLSPGQSVAMTVSTQTYGTHTKVPDVPVDLSVSGGIGSASVNGTALTATPQFFISDANGNVPVQFTAGTAPAGGGTDTLTVADAASSPVSLQASETYTYPQLVFTSGAQMSPPTSPASATLGPITVALEVGGTPIHATAAVTVNLGSSSTTGVFSPTSGGASVTSIIIQAGQSSATFYYGDATAGTPTLTASAGGAASATQKESVLSANGSGTIAPLSQSVTAASSGHTLIFTYTAAAGGMVDGSVDLQVPSGWSPPSLASSSAGYTTATIGDAAQSVSIGGGGSTIDVSGVTLAGGGTLVIEYADATAPHAAGSDTFAVQERSAASGALKALASSPIVTVTPGAAAKLVWTREPGGAVSTVALSPQPVLALEDPYGNVETGNSTGTVTVTLTTANGATLAGTASVTLQDGVATFAGLSIAKAGTYTLTPSTDVAGVTKPLVSDSFTIAPGPAIQLVWTTEPGGAPSASGLSPQPVLALEDASGNLETGISTGTVTLALTTTNGATLAGTTTITLIKGAATFTNLSVNKVGTYTLTPSTDVAGVTGVPVSSTLTITPGVATQLVWRTQPGGAASEAGLSPQPVLALEDAAGNVETGNSAGTVTVALTTAGGATLAGTTVVTLVRGVATFSGLSIAKAGAYTLTPSTDVGGVTNLPVSASFRIVPGPATQLVWTTEPGDAVAGSALTPQPVLTLKDAAGNVEAGDRTDTVTVRLNAANGAGLAGAARVTLQDGVATFAGLSVAEAGTYSLTAVTSAAGVPAVTSGSFTVAVGPAFFITVTPQSPSVPANGTVTVSGTVRDAAGNPVPDPAVTLAASSGDFGTVSPTVAGGYGATFTAPGTPGAVSITASVPGGPSVQTMVLVTPSGVSVTSFAVSAIHASIADLAATGLGGTGNIAVAAYGGNPGGTLPSATGAYFAVAPSAGSTFTAVTLQRCGVTVGQTLYGWNGATWAPVSPAPSFDAATGCLQVTLMAGSSPSLGQLGGTVLAVGGACPSFTDVPASYWAYPDIQTLACRGIVNGFSNGTFQPGGAVSRAQFVKMLVLTLGLKPGSGQTAFSDVPSGAWYAPYVSVAVQAGIVKGTSPTTFSPNATLTREQMAVLLARTLHLTQAATLRFTDATQIDAWALPGVEAAVAAGYIGGFPNGTFQPLGTATRAQAAKVLAMVLQQQRS